MKKLLSLILCLILCLSLFACNSEAEQTTKETNKTQQTEGTKGTQPTQSTDNSSKEENEKIEDPKPMIPGVPIPDLSSYTETDVTLIGDPKTDGAKIQLDGKIVCATLSQDDAVYSFDESEYLYNTVIMEHSLAKIKTAFENLTLFEEHDTLGLPVGDNGYSIGIYFDNGTYIGLGVGGNGHYVSANGTFYFPENITQGANISRAFRMPHSATHTFVQRDIPFDEHDENYICLPTKVSALALVQVQYKEEDTMFPKLTKKTIELSLNGAESNDLNEVIAFFETIELKAPSDVAPGRNIPYTDIVFYSENNEDYNDNCYMYIREIKIDEVHYLRINGKYYAMEDEQIEELYSKLTFSLQ